MNQAAPDIRPMEPRDLPAVSRIQIACPEASQWDPGDYLAYSAFVAEDAGRIVGFAVARCLPPDEIEILNVAVEPGERRRGLGRTLVGALLAVPGRTLYLEVRASNTAARALYNLVGFVESGVRRGYYTGSAGPGGPLEDAIVMKMQKW